MSAKVGNTSFSGDCDQDITLTWKQGFWHWKATAYRPGASSRKVVGKGKERSAALAAVAATRALLVFWDQER